MRIHSKIKDYSVEFCSHVLARNMSLIEEIPHARTFYFIDQKVFNIYRNKFKTFINDNARIIIPATEAQKSYLRLAVYYRKLIKKGFTRNDLLVTFGGGILQDISGFIASTLYRGIKWIFIPTTLLAQADSCIGSKTSINFDGSKNLIGTFYPPDCIFIDESFCNTLTPEYFNSGLGEIIKFHLMSNVRRYLLLKKYLSCQHLIRNKYFKDIIASTLNIKYSYFKGDEFDAGRRNLLNYGHCFGHALESASNFKLSHGEAVIVGMGFANLVSLQRGIMSKNKYDEFEQIFKKYYPRFDIHNIRVKDIVFFLKRDKKRSGKDLTMILSKDIGKQMKYDDISEKEIKEVYYEFQQNYQADIA
ncbi:MAG: 3-dehydroquinate synthase [bacterium]